MPPTGQIIDPEPRRIGPAAELPASRALHPRLFALERDEMALELLAVRSRRDERLALVGADRLVLLAAVDQPALDRGDLVAPVLDDRGDLALTGLGPVELLLGGGGLGARAADPVDDPRVLLGDALHELRALEQVGEAVGLEDHGDEVGLVGLVEMDEPLGQGDARLGQPRSQAHDPPALAAKVGLDGGQLRAPAAELTLDRRLPVAQRGDVVLQHVDAARVALDRARQDAFTLLLGPDRLTLLLDLLLQLLPVGRDGNDQPQHEGHRRDGDDEANVRHPDRHLSGWTPLRGAMQATLHSAPRRSLD